MLHIENCLLGIYYVLSIILNAGLVFIHFKMFKFKTQVKLLQGLLSTSSPERLAEEGRASPSDAGSSTSSSRPQINYPVGKPLEVRHLHDENAILLMTNSQILSSSQLTNPVDPTNNL